MVFGTDKGSSFGRRNDGNSNGGRPNRGNDWICTDSSCNANNFASRTECFKCHEPKGDAKDAPPRSDQNRSRPRGNDWICTDSSCAAKNFANRTECFKCHEPKGDAQDAPAGDSSNDRRGSNWTCTNSSCGADNFPSRTECFKCKEPKGDATSSTKSSGDRNNRGEDWTCSDDSCAASNFASRSACYKCKTPKGGGDGDGDGEKAEKPKSTYVPPDIEESDLFNHDISQGINFDKFNDIPVKVTGDDIPPPSSTFRAAGLHDFLLGNVERCNYGRPTPIQQYAMPIIKAKRDLMGCAQTGSGKTAAFLLPIISMLMQEEKPCQPGAPHVLVVTPTRELAKQIYIQSMKFAKSSIINSTVIYGGTSTQADGPKLAVN